MILRGRSDIYWIIIYMNIAKMEKSLIRQLRQVKNTAKQFKEEVDPSASLLQVNLSATKPVSRRLKVQAHEYQFYVSKFFKEQLSDTEIYIPGEPLRNRYRFVDKSKLSTEKIFVRIQKNLQLLSEKLDELNPYESRQESLNEEDESSDQQDIQIPLKCRQKGQKPEKNRRSVQSESSCEVFSFLKVSKLSSKKTSEE